MNTKVSSKMKMDGRKLVFLDVETTGLSPAYGDRICEIGILQCKGFQIEEEYGTLVNPGRNISPGASAVNGITDEMVRSAPFFHELADDVLGYLQDAVIVCHNVPFDMGFMQNELERSGRTIMNREFIDTLKIARRYFGFPSNSLPNIADYLNIRVKEKHRALADVYTTHRVLTHLTNDLANRGLDSVEDLLIIEIG